MQVRGSGSVPVPPPTPGGRSFSRAHSGSPPSRTGTCAGEVRGGGGHVPPPPRVAGPSSACTSGSAPYGAGHARVVGSPGGLRPVPPLCPGGWNLPCKPYPSGACTGFSPSGQLCCRLWLTLAPPTPSRLAPSCSPVSVQQGWAWPAQRLPHSLAETWGPATAFFPTGSYHWYSGT